MFERVDESPSPKTERHELTVARSALSVTCLHVCRTVSRPAALMRLSRGECATCPSHGRHEKQTGNVWENVTSVGAFVIGMSVDRVSLDRSQTVRNPTVVKEPRQDANIAENRNTAREHFNNERRRISSCLQGSGFHFLTLTLDAPIPAEGPESLVTESWVPPW